VSTEVYSSRFSVKSVPAVEGESTSAINRGEDVDSSLPSAFAWSITMSALRTPYGVRTAKSALPMS
jgi:hypothetical protein